MSNERIQIPSELAQKISSMLQSQGISQIEITQIINGEYERYDTEYDLESAFGGLKKHGDVLEKLSDGYTMNELELQGISTQKIQAFNEMLKEKNLTVENAKAIYQYSIGSNMILGVKRGTTKETIQEQIMQDLEEALQGRGVSQADIEKMKQFVKSADYQYTLHSNYDIANEYMEQIGLQQNSRVSVRSAMQSMDRCIHIYETIASLEEGVGSTKLSKSMKLYRAVKSSYLEKGLQEGEDLRSLVGKSLSNDGQTSTSPLYDSSFASLDEYDTVFEIYAPLGSRGSYIAELSAYDKTEQEVLLNPNDLYIIDVQTGVVDKNGRTKNVIQALALSKDRECYKSVSPTNLPTRQNIFSRFFSQFRTRFSRKKVQESQAENTYLQQTKSDEAKTKEKKSWKLEPEEKARTQNETAEIAQKHLEQDQTLNKGQVPVQQQHMVDIGEIEL